MYFIIVTFAALQLLGIVATISSGLTGGGQGLALPIPTWSLTYQNWPFYTRCWPCWCGHRRLRLGPARQAGLGLFAIPDDEGKAAARPGDQRLQVIAFVLGGTSSASPAAIYAYYHDVPQRARHLQQGHEHADHAVGAAQQHGTLGGAGVGAFIIEPSPTSPSTSLGGWPTPARSRLLLFSGLLGLMVLFLPRGLIPTVSAWKNQRHSSRSKTR